MTWAGRRSALRDEAHRRVRMLTALAGAGSLAGTGGVLVAVSGTGFTSAPVANVASTMVAPHHRPPASLVTTKKARHHAIARHRRAHVIAAPAHPRPPAAAPKRVTHQAPAPAPATYSPAPQPQPTDSSGSSGSGCCSHSGGSH